MAENKITLGMIARLAGVSRSTASRALSGHRWTSPETIRKVKKIADQLGYIPDAHLNKLMAHLRKSRQPVEKPSLALLSLRQRGEKELASKGRRNNANGVLQRARELGYTLEFFDLFDSGLTPKRLSQIWWNRGINGIIIHSLNKPSKLEGFDWDLFSWVTMGYSLREPELHRIVINYQKLVWLGITKALEARGQRIGFFLPSSLDENTLFHYRSAWLGYHNYAGEGKLLPLFLGNLQEREAFGVWLRKYKPEIVLVPGGRTELAARSFFQSELSPRQKRPMILNLSLDSPESENDGIYQDAVEVGTEAVNYLVQLIHSDEKGIPRSPKAIMVSGVWVDGSARS